MGQRFRRVLYRKALHSAREQLLKKEHLQQPQCLAGADGRGGIRVLRTVSPVIGCK